MPLAALILCTDADDGAVMPALLPIAGQTMLEYQARSLRGAGAGHIVLLADRMPAAMVAAIDRLKTNGVDIDVVRAASDAADSVHPDEQLLVIANGIVAPIGVLNAVLAGDGLTLLSVADAPETQRFERIDAAQRWTGIALLDGRVLRETAAMLGDWQLGPTLLRVALQRGANRLIAAEPAAIATPATPAEADSTTKALSIAAQPCTVDWFDRWCIAPIARRLAHVVMAKTVPVSVITFVAVILVIAAFGAALVSSLWAAMLLALLATLLIFVADIVGQVGARSSRLLQGLIRHRNWGFAALLMAFATRMSVVNGDHLLAMATAWLASLALLRRGAATPLLAAPGGLSALLLIGFATGWALPLLLLVIAYSFGSLIRYQGMAERP